KEEQEYVKSLSTVNIGLKISNSLNYYSNSLGKYTGIIPLFIEDFSKNTGIKIRMMSDRNNSWDNLYSDFLNKKIDVLAFSENKKWDENIIFTKRLYKVKIYKITSFYSTTNKVGVIKDSVESNFARDFYKNGEIQNFEDYDALEKALNANRVSAILLFDISSLDTSKFIVNDFMKISIVLGFDKENFILRDIFNKWLENTSNLNKIIENSEMIKKQDAFNEYQKFKIINRVLYILLSIFSFTLIISFIKIYLNEKITNELKKDSLTGLPNRKEFLNFILNNKKLEGYAITIDIDNFKELNDRYGETIGDNVLKIVSQSIQNVFKKEEIYKVAGDEFNIFFEELDIIERLEKLKKEIKILNTLYCLNLSIGYYKNKDENLERAFEYATMGMEEAKKKNGTNYLEGTEELLKRKKRENSIKSILRSQNLSGLYAIYQPKFSIKTKKIVGAESLARWQDSNLGFISPLEFINIAEKIDLIYLIDFEIATQAIKFIKYLKEKELVDNEFIISFNLS
ncbi:MAG: diguanylate cyclase domain-containing protein, partial [Cetobacterium sp.]